MTDARQPPPSTVKSYSTGVQARARESQQEKRANPVFPNLGEAAMTPRTSDEPLRTLQQLGEQQRADAQSPDPAARALSDETVKGLTAIRQEQEKKAAEQARQEAAAAEALPKATEEDEYDPEGPDDIALMRAMKAARADVARNERERLAVAARVPEIDLAEGLVTGEFTQLVPVVPGKLTVKYRCLSTGEFDQLRLFLINKVQADKRLNDISASLLSFYQTVASIGRINETVYAAHMAPDSSGFGLDFQAELFEAKVRKFAAFPSVLMATLNIHGVWFERRVQELFVTAEALKNG
jgi:hypothetical protein